MKIFVIILLIFTTSVSDLQKNNIDVNNNQRKNEYVNTSRQFANLKNDPPYDHSNQYYKFDSVEIKLFQPQNMFELIAHVESHKIFPNNAPNPLELTYSINGSAVQSLDEQFSSTGLDKKDMIVNIPMQQAIDDKGVININLDLHYYFIFLPTHVVYRSDPRIYSGTFNIGDFLKITDQYINNDDITNNSISTGLPLDITLNANDNSYTYTGDKDYVITRTKSLQDNDEFLGNSVFKITEKDPDHDNFFTTSVSQGILNFTKGFSFQKIDMGIIENGDNSKTIFFNEENYYDPISDKVVLGYSCDFHSTHDGLNFDPYVWNNPGEIVIPIAFTGLLSFGVCIHLTFNGYKPLAGESGIWRLCQDDIDISKLKYLNTLFFSANDDNKFKEGITFDQFENDYWNH
ncbi:hypothetical protein ASO20_02160 [Mycoplasma sp. (ex Biomphalaria glabrata)]|uniref:hypothetical protein n=1 Tax=Mycoplasma sp. (ex Biomphalaria glabrata) TaxID=1749074 RepID=UPI00073AA24C|nr:hypothetical protein [Mycoplasma sp. (ex Biomphalaria glabrata)]ALV23445.1 hypothetical protein ASO20_02160 [Mycoplasma sp. (ex Biomphalaria glabrata)]